MLLYAGTHLCLHCPSGAHRLWSAASAYLSAAWQLMHLVFLHPVRCCCLQVCDFGISKMKDASLAASSTRLQAGTPAYMAPEQFEGCSATEKVDVFSFAVLLWECCEQQQPWRDLSPMQIIYAVGLQVRGCTMSLLKICFCLASISAEVKEREGTTLCCTALRLWSSCTVQYVYSLYMRPTSCGISSLHTTLQTPGSCPCCVALRSRCTACVSNDLSLFLLHTAACRRSA